MSETNTHLSLSWCESMFHTEQNPEGFHCNFQGTAVFWYNLFPSGEGDYSTRHAACPVLVGNKWGKYASHCSHLLAATWRSGACWWVVLVFLCLWASQCKKKQPEIRSFIKKSTLYLHLLHLSLSRYVIVI